MKKTKTKTFEQELGSNEFQQDVDKEILLQLNKRKDESEALRKILMNLNEPSAKKSKQSK